MCSRTSRALAIACAALASLLGLAACATTAPPREPPRPSGPGFGQAAAPGSGKLGQDPSGSASGRGPSFPTQTRGEVEAGKLAAKARAALEVGHLTEAILSYLGVIALYRESGEDSLRSAAETAAAELGRIGARLSLEPGSEWLDEKGGQLPASGRGVGKAGGLSPSVYLYENFGSGKSPVADAPIYFEFTENAGSLISLVATDAYGKANTTLSALESPGKAALIRAYPVFRVRETRYAFRSVFREFSYLPPARSARLLLIESGLPGTGGGNQTLDALLGVLKALGLELSPLEAGKTGEVPESAPLSEAEAFSRLGSAGYLALAQIEASAPRQMELGGKKYNIFTSEASAGFRLLRSDGSAVFALPLGGFKGQGWTGEAAAADAGRKAREALVAALGERIGMIEEAIARD